MAPTLALLSVNLEVNSGAYRELMRFSVFFRALKKVDKST